MVDQIFLSLEQISFCPLGLRVDLCNWRSKLIDKFGSFLVPTIVTKDQPGDALAICLRGGVPCMKRVGLRSDVTNSMIVPLCLVCGSCMCLHTAQLMP